MVQVKKRNGRIEEFVESKIATGVRKAGATAEEAAEVAKDVSAKVAHRVEVTAAEMSTMVVTSLRKVNRKASAEFVKFRDTKLKAMSKKELAKLALLSTTLKTKVE